MNIYAKQKQNYRYRKKLVFTKGEKEGGGAN